MDNDIEKDSTEIATLQKEDSTPKATTIDESETKGSILSESNFTKNPIEKIVSKTINVETKEAAEDSELATPDTNNSRSSSTKPEIKKVSKPWNFTIQKILNGCKTGETLTQEELSKNLEIPQDAIRLVKSITKISENEIDVKWNSTWAVEKISDAKFTERRLKVRFADNKIYTSGNAIGIKYEKNIY